MTTATAIIFDMDGVLVDGERLHYGAARAILAEQGIQLDVATYAGYVGRTGRDIWEDLRARFDLRTDFETYSARYDATLAELYRTAARPLPGARAALDQVRAAGLPCALASSSRREWVQIALATLRFGDYFQGDRHRGRSAQRQTGPGDLPHRRRASRPRPPRLRSHRGCAGRH